MTLSNELVELFMRVDWLKKHVKILHRVWLLLASRVDDLLELELRVHFQLKHQSDQHRDKVLEDHDVVENQNDSSLRDAVSATNVQFQGVEH